MIRHDIADALRDDELAPGYVRPAYDDYCFANIPGTVADLVGSSGTVDSPKLPEDTLPTTDIDRVAVVLVDGFGFEQFLRHRGAHPFLDTLAEEAVVTPLTSTYPSETAAAMTTYDLGRPPVQHGLLGWDVYRPDIDAVVKPLPFETAGGANPAEFSLSRTDMREGESVGHQLSGSGVDVRQVVPDALVGNDTGSGGGGGQSYHGYAETDRDELAESLQGALTSVGDPGFVHTYIPAVDAAGHNHGTSAPEYRETVSGVFDAVERAIEGIPTERASETLVVVCADHGHVDTDPEQNVDLLSVLADPGIIGETTEGTPRISGGPRNLHLHVDDPEATRDTVQVALTDCGCEALVLTREEALGEELWGPGAQSTTFKRHCGDVLVIPDQLSVWHTAEAHALDLIGEHGGCHPDEMLVPFASARADQLQ